MTDKDNTPKKANDEQKLKSTDSQKSDSPKKQNKTPFWKKHFLSLLLLLAVGVSIVWALISQNRLEKKHEAEIEQLISDHNSVVNDLVLDKAKLTTSTLALAVRSELIDENKDQVNQYFLQMIKNKQISKIMLVNHKSGQIEMSTNRKDESTIFQNKNLLTAKNVVSEDTGSVITTATPVMGLNNQMAVLVVEITK